MANARKNDPGDEKARLNAALQEYASRMPDVPQVAGVALAPGPERDLFTYIDERDWDVCYRLMDVEDVLFEMFDDVLFDFHIRYLEGRSLEEAKPSSAEVIYRGG
jgi:hypothetical protein